jgi:hypothetical protein
MRRMVLAAAGLSMVALATAPAMAEGRCGPDRYRNGPFGHCHWKGPPPPPPGYYGPPPGYYGPGPSYGPPAYVVDRWYPGRGYWDGGRWWGHRHHWHGGWR